MLNSLFATMNPDDMKNLTPGFISILLVLLSGSEGFAATTGISSEQAHSMKEEYQVVRQMRHQLRYLLERQKTENTLQEGEDVFQDLQQMEQWLEQMKQSAGDEKMEELLDMLETLENRLSQSLEAQEEAGRWLGSRMTEDGQTQIPLASLMNTLRDLIRNRQFEQAQDLLDQLQSALTQQQQALEQALASENLDRFSQSSRQLRQMMSRTQQALAQETMVQNLLQPHTSLKQIPGAPGWKAESLQRHISELIRQVQSSLQQLPDSTLLNMQMSLRELKISLKHSQNTENRLAQSLPMPAFKSARNTRNSLERLNQNLGQLQEQVQQMSRGRRMARSEGRGQRYWSEKGIRPIRLEYEFQANPLFRERIQQQKSRNIQRRTRLQQQYLKEVMR